MEDDPEHRENSFHGHPKLREMYDMGIKSSKILQNSLLVYLQLIEIQNWFDVELVPAIENQVVFIKGRRTSKVDKMEYVLPIGSNETFTTEHLNSLIDAACQLGCSDKSLLLAFVDSGSTVVFYQINKGLIPPAKPSQKELLKMSKLPEWNERKGKWK